MKNKKILIIIAVIFATLLIILAGTLFVFFKTDLFKSNKQLFFENTINTFQFTKDFNFDNLIDTEKDLQGKPQTKKGIITVEPNFTEYIIQEKIKNVIDNSYIGYVFNSNPENNQSELMIGAYHNKKKVESISLLNDNEKIGLYCYDLYPKCIYFENNNLKEYFKKFNINTDFLPDKITNYSLSDRYSDTKKIYENIMKKYSEIITTKLNDKNFKNKKNVETTINGEKLITSQYSLTLSEIELLDLQIEFMEAVKNDENLINQYIEQSKKNNSTLSKFLLSINFSKYLSYISNSNLDTVKIAKSLAKLLNKGDTVVLTGELGSGKTKFTEGFLSYYNLQDEISSPTFNIVNEYKTPFSTIYHFDVYRLFDINEFYEI